MLSYNLPSVGIKLTFNGNWLVTRSDGDGDSIELTEGVYSRVTIGRFVTFFLGMWNSACYMAEQKNTRLLPGKPQALPFQLPEGMEWSNDLPNICYSVPAGLQLSYVDGEDYWTEDNIWSLFEYLVSLCPDSDIGALIIGAIHRNYAEEHFYYLQAAKTGHCVRYDYDTGKWTDYEGEPTGVPTVSTVGIIAYAEGGREAPELPAIISGVNRLVTRVSFDYSTDLLKDVPELMFLTVVYSSPLEQALPLTTNANRLFYLLNAERDIPDLPESVEVPGAGAELPELRWEAVSTVGEPVALGGAFIIDGGSGEYEMRDVVRWLSEAFTAYETFASRFDDSSLSKLAIAQFVEKFSTIRIDPTPSKPSKTVPLQFEIAPSVYEWDDVRWYPIAGSQKVYPEVHDTFRYMNMVVEMTPALWTTLLKSVIEQFMSPECPGLAHLYYLVTELPDEDSAFEGEVHIVDHWRMQEAAFDGKSWTIKDAAPYSNKAKLTDTGLAITVSGTGTVSAKHLAEIVKGAYEQAAVLLKNKFKEIDELCKDTAYGTYEQLHAFMPEALLAIRSMPMGGIVNNVISPIVLYKDKQRLSHTATGWFYNNVPRDRTKKAGKLGEYTIGYETGTYPWGDDVARVIKDVLELTMDYTSPEVIASLELEHAN